MTDAEAFLIVSIVPLQFVKHYKPILKQEDGEYQLRFEVKKFFLI